MTTSVAKNVQQEVASKLALVEKALSNIKEEAQKPMQTNGMFTFSPNANAIHIHTIKSLAMLLEITSFLNAKQNGYEAAAKQFNLSEYPPFTWSGYPHEAWMNDIGIRVAVLTSEEKKRKLSDAKRVLESLQNEEAKTKRILSSLEGLLG